VPVQEVLVADVGGGRHQPADIDLRAAPEEDAFGLTIQTLPLACSTPLICEALPPVTVERDRPIPASGR